MAKIIQNVEEFDALLKSEKPVLVDFFATWCMPCRMLAPIMERVESSLQDVKFYSVDIDEGEEIAKRYRIFSVPTLVAFRDGKKVDSLVGLNSFDDIVEFVNRCKTADFNED